MLRHIISIIIQHFVYSNVQVLTLSAQLKIYSNGVAWHSISIINPPTLALWHLFKNITIFVVLISKLNKNRTEIMCQNLFTGRIVQNIVEIIILFVFFLP